MNSLNKILPIVAVIAAVGAAIVPAHKSGAQTSGDSYYWFQPDGKYDGYHSQSEEQTLRGCSGAAVICAEGYNTNQLDDPSRPQDGPGDGQVSVQQVKKN